MKIRYNNIKIVFIGGINMKQPIELSSDFSERLDYNLPDLPLYARQNFLSHYGYRAITHWHSDLEFILVVDGFMDYFINGEIIHLTSGNGVFINSQRLHYGFSESMSECIFYALIISPSLFFEHSLVTKKYFHEKFGAFSQNYIALNKEIDWQNKILNMIPAINEQIKESKPNILRLLSLSAGICAEIGEFLISTQIDVEDDYHKNVVWKMTDYIHRNYDKKISLDNIAKIGEVCRSKCCQLFKKYLRQSPNRYIIRYRLSKSCELLRNTDMSISEIALCCGFQDSSYFTAVFSKEIGTIPKKFRKKSREDNFLNREHIYK